MDPILEVDGLSLRYHLETGYVTALEDIAFSLYRGDTMGLVGESGCGKSSLALAIMGILPENAEITSGKIIFEGQDLLQLPDQVIRRNIRWKKI